jgi:hypothetical protein
LSTASESSLCRHGGLGWGQSPVALGWAVAIIYFVAYLALSRTDVAKTTDPSTRYEPDEAAQPHHNAVHPEGA